MSQDFTNNRIFKRIAIDFHSTWATLFDSSIQNEVVQIASLLPPSLPPSLSFLPTLPPYNSPHHHHHRKTAVVAWQEHCSVEAQLAQEALDEEGRQQTKRPE